MKHLKLSILVLIHFLIGGKLYAQLTILQPDSVEAGDNFGHAVDIDGDYLIASSQNAEVFIFENINSAWTQTLKVSNFGREVAIDGDFAFIGQPFDVGFKGSTTILQNIQGTWSNLGIVNPLDASGHFGCAIDIDGNFLAIGSRTNSNFSPVNSGAVSIYSLQNGTWARDSTIKPLDVDRDDEFGTSVSIENQLLLAGSPGEDDFGFGFERGAAYIFDLSNQPFTELVKISSSDGENGDLFGYSLVLSGNYAIIGAPGDDDIATDAGAVYVFENIAGNWTEIQKLTIPNIGSNAQFGRRIYEHNGDVIISSFTSFSAGVTGRVYQIENVAGQWAVKYTYLPANVANSEYYAWDIALSDNHLVAGAWGRDNTGINSGQVFITDRSSITGMVEKDITKKIKVWPNPASNSINIELPDNFRNNYQVSLSDLQGKRIENLHIVQSSNIIELNWIGLRAGSYLLKVQNDSQIFSQIVLIN